MTLQKLSRDIRGYRSLFLAGLILFFTGIVLGAQYSPLIKNRTWQLTGKTSELDYCELVQGKELFHKTTVRFKARIGADTSGLYLYGCATGVSANLTAFILEDATSLSEEARQWLQRLQDEGKETPARSGAWFTGEFNAKLSTGCYGPEFGLKVKTIEDPEPISFEPEDLNGMPVETDPDAPPLRRYH
jgi:hypothetical protein